MNRVALAIGAFAAASLVVTGCTSTVVKLEEAIPCPIADTVLAERCAEPQALGDGATYADVVTAAQADRGHLKSCAGHDELLRSAIAACNLSIAQHNEAIRSINQKFASKP